VSLPDIPESTFPRARRPRTAGWMLPQRLRIRIVTGLVVLLAVLAGAVGVRAPSSAAGLQPGPDPTADSLGKDGPFVTASVTVGPGNGFGGGTIYYPTDMSQGTFGGIVIGPGFGTGRGQYEWIGAKLATHGFVAFVTDTNGLGDPVDARSAQLLAAVDFLTKSSPVSDRVDGSRMAVSGHSAGGAAALGAAARRPDLKAVIGLAPGEPDMGGLLQAMSGLGVPAMIIAAQNDRPAPKELYDAVKNAPKSYLEIAGEGHGFPAGGNMVMFRSMVPWLKVFLDKDTRYTPFLCSGSGDGLSKFENTCPLTP
jgi:pimeloyl-ACP methyl ester carboxylesterase